MSTFGLCAFFAPVTALLALTFLGGCVWVDRHMADSRLARWFGPVLDKDSYFARGLAFMIMGLKRCRQLGARLRDVAMQHMWETSVGVVFFFVGIYRAWQFTQVDPETRKKGFTHSGQRKHRSISGAELFKRLYDETYDDFHPDDWRNDEDRNRSIRELYDTWGFEDFLEANGRDEFYSILGLVAGVRHGKYTIEQAADKASNRTIDFILTNKGKASKVLHESSPVTTGTLSKLAHGKFNLISVALFSAKLAAHHHTWRELSDLALYVQALANGFWVCVVLSVVFALDFAWNMTAALGAQYTFSNLLRWGIGGFLLCAMCVVWFVWKMYWRVVQSLDDLRRTVFVNVVIDVLSIGLEAARDEGFVLGEANFDENMFLGVTSMGAALSLGWFGSEIVPQLEMLNTVIAYLRGIGRTVDRVALSKRLSLNYVWPVATIACCYLLYRATRKSRAAVFVHGIPLPTEPSDVKVAREAPVMVPATPQTSAMAAGSGPVPVPTNLSAVALAAAGIITEAKELKTTGTTAASAVPDKPKRTRPSKAKRAKAACVIRAESANPAIKAGAPPPYVDCVRLFKHGDKVVGSYFTCTIDGRNMNMTAAHVLETLKEAGVVIPPVYQEPRSDLVAFAPTAQWPCAKRVLPVSGSIPSAGYVGNHAVANWTMFEKGSLVAGHYHAASTTSPGDSGTPWLDSTHRVIGVHSGSLPNRPGYNACTILTGNFFREVAKRSGATSN